MSALVSAYRLQQNHTRRGKGGIRGTRTSQQLAGKQKANEVATTGDSMESANRHQTPALGPYICPQTQKSRVTQAADGSQKPGLSGGGATNVAVLAAPAAPSQPIGPLKLTAMESDPSEPGVSMETTNRRMCSDMSRPLSGMPDGTT